MSPDAGEFRAILAGSVLGMAVLDGDGRFLEVNDSLCTVLGRSAHDLTSLTWSDVTHPQDREDGRADEAQLRAGAREDLAARQRLVRPDGQVRHTDVCKVLIRAAREEQPIVVCQVVDVSDQVAPPGGDLSGRRSRRLAARVLGLPERPRHDPGTGYRAGPARAPRRRALRLPARCPPVHRPPPAGLPAVLCLRGQPPVSRCTLDR